MAFVLEDVVFYLGMIWAAVIIGVLVGWTWKPRWANLERRKLGLSVESEVSSRLEGLGLSSLGFSFVPSFHSMKVQWLQNLVRWVWEDRVDKERFERAGADSECWLLRCIVLKNSTIQIIKRMRMMTKAFTIISTIEARWFLRS